MKSSRTLRGALWIVGEYATDQDGIELCMERICECIGKVPIIDAHSITSDEDDGLDLVSEKVKSPTNGVRRVLADGTYATESAYSVKPVENGNSLFHRTPLRGIVLVFVF